MYNSISMAFVKKSDLQNRNQISDCQRRGGGNGLTTVEQEGTFGG